MRYLMLLVFLVGCRSPDRVDVQPGYSWYNVDSAGWRGQSVGLSIGWSFGAQRDAQLAATRTAKLLQQLNERQVAMMMHQDVADPVVVNVDAGQDVEVEAPVIEVEATGNTLGVPDKAVELLTDTTAGAYGIPNMVWGLLVLGGAVLIAHFTGLLPKRKKAKK